MLDIIIMSNITISKDYLKALQSANPEISGTTLITCKTVGGTDL